MDVSTRRIVVLGKTGAGKSSLANTIFGEAGFQINHSPNSGTSKCQAMSKDVNKQLITWIDTPGFFDTEKPEEELKSEIMRCIVECTPGPHAVVIVLKVEKYREHEKGVIKKMCQYFSEDVLKYAVIVFTHGDQLPETERIEDFVKQSKDLNDVVTKCGNRCHVFDNKYWKNNQEDEYRSNKFQTTELLKTINKLTEKNNGGCYTNAMLEAVQKEKQEEEEHLRQSPGHMSEEDIKQQAKASVFEKLLIRMKRNTFHSILLTFLGVASGIGVLLARGK